MEHRGTLVIGMAMLTVFIGLANLYLALYVGNRVCGGEADPFPDEGSPLGAYCSLLEDPDDRLTFLAGVFFYGPVIVTVIGGMLAVARKSPSTARRTGLVAVAYLALLLLPTLVLPR